MGLDGLIHAAADLHGIVNGIDTEVWNPETDSHVAAGYSAKSLGARAKNRRAVEERFSLDHSDAPIFCIVSRLTWQKGMDLLAPSLDDLVATGARLAVLGSGDAAWKARCSPRPRGIRAASASSSAMTRRCRICCRPAATPSWCHRASSPAA